MDNKAISLAALATMPEELAEFRRLCGYTLPHLVESPNLTDDEKEYIRTHHGPCPLTGPHTDDCNILEVIKAVFERRRQK